MITAITPTVTPSIEMKEMTEIERLLPLGEQVSQGDVQFEGIFISSTASAQ